MSGNLNERLRKLPAVNTILNYHRINELKHKYGHNLVAEAAAKVLESWRKRLTEKDDYLAEEDYPGLDTLYGEVEDYLFTFMSSHYKTVINATGIILHTNLGRSLLCDSAKEALIMAASCYTNLEYDLEKKERGERYAHVEEFLIKLTGADSALVVNNNAAAVLLVLNSMANDREVIVSRGELVEIGGSFRIPEVLKLGGVRLNEVGTTNRTHLKDYINAINDSTGLILKVHTSNYRITGFTKSVDRSQLVELSREKGLPFVEDLGSGTLVDLSAYGLKEETPVPHVIKAGVDIVTFSGDKLLGGPQAGIIVGKKDYIDIMKRNQLTRALRVDKFTLAALESTLREYLCPETVVTKIPIYRILTVPMEELEKKAQRIKKAAAKQGDRLKVDLIGTKAQMGGGSLPGQDIPSVGIVINVKDMTPEKVELELRSRSTPILGYIEKNNYILDMRTLLPGDEDVIIESLLKLGAEEPCTGQ